MFVFLVHQELDQKVNISLICVLSLVIGGRHGQSRLAVDAVFNADFLLFYSVQRLQSKNIKPVRPLLLLYLPLLLPHCCKAFLASYHRIIYLI